MIFIKVRARGMERPAYKSVSKKKTNKKKYIYNESQRRMDMSAYKF